MHKPRHLHDCNACEYIGGFSREGQWFDVYVCPQSGWPTVVQRYGDGAADYHSGAHLVDRLPAMLHAMADYVMARLPSAARS